jgi:hypothetical protein
MVAKNRQAIGESNGFSKITEKDVLEIREMADNGMDYGDIAPLFGVTLQNISQISRGISWKRVGGNIQGPRNWSQRLRRAN